MIPLPGSGFVYSLLKDVRNWGLTRLRGRRLTVAGARGWTVDQWYHPAEAVKEFGDQNLLQLREEAEQRRDEALAERGEGITIGDRPIPPYRSPEVPETPEEAEARKRFSALDQQYDDTRRKVDALTYLIREDLIARLTRGELIARGFREPFSHGAPYLTISRHEWRVIGLQLADRAGDGGGVSYVGLTIGKVGTKSLFWRRNR
jgi:hypothetical protein